MESYIATVRRMATIDLQHLDDDDDDEEEETTQGLEVPDTGKVLGTTTTSVVGQHRKPTHNTFTTSSTTRSNGSIYDWNGGFGTTTTSLVNYQAMDGTTT